MKSARTWCAVAVGLMLVAGLTACKSNPRKSCRTACPPVVTQAPRVVQPTVPPSAPDYPMGMTDVQSPAISQAELDAARDREGVERARRADLERQLRVEQERVVSAQGELAAMKDKIAQLEEEPPAGAAPTPDMTVPAPDAAQQLTQDLRARSSADVIRSGDLVTVRVTNGFKAGSDLLKRDVELIQTLYATADALSRYPGASVAVVGHSDTDPIKKSRKKWASNDELSMARAQRVAQVLADNGVNRHRISIDGRGAREPLVAPERSASDKARNRRVEIMIRL